MELSFKVSRPTRLVLGLALTFAVSYMTYLHRVGDPPHFYWDENYHLASAQKYLNGIFFMEPHPPLGKLLIALGEKLVPQNEANDQFVDTDYAKNLPEGFVFTSYRFFPALLACLAAPVLYGFFFLLSDRHVFAFVLTSFYMLDNAFIVHNRGAMLEGPIVFFVSVLLLVFLLLYRWKGSPRRLAAGGLLYGAVFGLLLATKTIGLIMILPAGALLLWLSPDWRSCVRLCGTLTAGFLLSYPAVWMIHFSIASEIHPKLSKEGYYRASEEYKKILENGENRSLSAFPVMFRDSLAFFSHYEKGVPKLDLCKPGENGSPFFLWPVGARSINYRWETPDGKSYRYLYLQANPAVWWGALLGVFLAASLLTASLLYPLGQLLEYRFLIATFLAVYVSYMIAVAQIRRVMYLYHYFIPLLLSFVLLGLVLLEIRQVWRIRMTERKKTAVLLGALLVVAASFQFYSPLTFYRPIDDGAFKKRMIFRLWDLRCVKCERDSPLVKPRECE